MEHYKVVLQNFQQDEHRPIIDVPVYVRDTQKYPIHGLISIVDCFPEAVTFSIEGSHPNISLLGELHVSHWSDEIMGDIEDKLLVNMVYGE